MNRKVKAGGFLYVAPPNLDFSQPCHSAKRWQRRWFSLYDNGDLSYALDSNVCFVVLLNFLDIILFLAGNGATAYHGHAQMYSCVRSGCNNQSFT